MNIFSAKLCPFFKMEGLVCMKTRIKNVLIDEESKWVITYGEDSDIIIWDLERMNDIQTISGENSPIAALSLDAASKSLYKLNSNGLLTILTYPSAEILFSTRLAILKNPLHAYFHPKLSYILIISQDKLQFKAVDYKNTLSTTSSIPTFTFTSAFTRFQVYSSTTTIAFVLYFTDATKTTFLEFNGTAFIERTYTTTLTVPDLFNFASSSYSFAARLSYSISPDKQSIYAYDYTSDSLSWTYLTPQALINYIKPNSAGTFLMVFYADNTISLHSLTSGSLYTSITTSRPINAELAELFDSSQTRSLIAPDYTGSVFVFNFSADNSTLTLLNDIKMSDSVVQRFFALDPSYYVFETGREIQGFFILEADTLKHSSIKCLRSSASFAVNNDPVQGYFGSVIEESSFILVRYFLFELDAWDYRTNKQIFYDNISLKSLNNNNNNNNRIISVIFSSFSGVLISAQSDSSIGVWNLRTGVLVSQFDAGSEVISLGMSDSYSTRFFAFQATQITIIDVINLQTNQLSITTIPLSSSFTQTHKPLHGSYLIFSTTNSLTSANQLHSSASTLNVGNVYSFNGVTTNTPCSPCWVTYLFTSSDLSILQISIYDNSSNQMNAPSIRYADSKLFCVFNDAISVIELVITANALSTDNQYTIQLPYIQTAFLLSVEGSTIFVSSGQKVTLLDFSGNQLQVITYSASKPRANESILFDTDSSIVIVHNSIFLFVFDTERSLTLKSESYDNAPNISTTYLQESTLFIGYENNQIKVMKLNESIENTFAIAINSTPVRVLSYLTTEGQLLYEIKTATIAKSQLMPFKTWTSTSTDILDSKLIIQTNVDPADESLISFTTIEATTDDIFYHTQINLQTLQINQTFINLTQLFNATYTAQSKGLFIFDLYSSDTSKLHVLTLMNSMTRVSSLHVLSSTFDAVLVSLPSAHLTEISDIQRSDSSSRFTTYSKTSRKLKYWRVTFDNATNKTSLSQLGSTISLASPVSTMLCDFTSSQVIIGLSNSRTLQVFNMLHGNLLKVIDSLPSECTTISLNLNSNMLIVAESVGRIIIFDYTSFIPVSRIASLNSQISWISYSDSLSLMIVQTDMNSIFVYDIYDDETTLQTSDYAYTLKFFLQLDNTISNLLFEESTQTLFIAVAECIKAWDILTGLFIGERCITKLGASEYIDSLYFIMHSQQILVFTNQRIIAQDVMLISSRKASSEQVLSMDQAVKESIYIPQSDLLLYTEVIIGKSVGMVEVWNSDSEKMVLVHSGFDCKPLHLFRIEEVFVIICPLGKMRLADSHEFLITEDPIQFKEYSVTGGFDIIEQSPTKSNLFYAILLPYQLSLIYVCLDADEDALNRFNQVRTINACQDGTHNRIEYIRFIDSDLLAVLCENGSFSVLSSLLTSSVSLIGAHASLVENVQIDSNRSLLVSFDKNGRICLFSLFLNVINVVAGDNSSKSCELADTVEVAQIEVVMSLDSGMHFQSNVLMESIGSMAMQTKARANIVFVSMNTLTIQEIIYVPSYGLKAKMLAGFTDNQLLLITSAQVNLIEVAIKANKIVVHQNGLLLDRSVIPFKKLVQIQPNLLVITGALGYQVIEIEASDDGSSSTTSILSSKFMNKMRLPIMSSTESLIDSDNNLNLIIRGYFVNGLFWHNFPVNQDHESICEYEIRETELWIVDRTLENLEKTYEMTKIQVDLFYIIVYLDSMGDLTGLPKLSFIYNSILHFKSSDQLKKQISFSDENFSLDITEWTQVIIENFTFLVSSAATVQPVFHVMSSNSACTSLQFINVDFTLPSYPLSQSLSKQSYSNKTVMLKLQGFSDILLSGITLVNSTLTDSCFLTMVDTISLNIISLNATNSTFTNSSLIQAKQKNLSKQSTNIQLTSLTFSDNKITSSTAIFIDNSNYLTISSISIVNNIATDSYLFSLHGIHLHHHYNSFFTLNSNLMYLTQSTAIQQQQKSSYRYKITDSSLDIANITLSSSSIIKLSSLIHLEALNISLVNCTLYNITTTRDTSLNNSDPPQGYLALSEVVNYQSNRYDFSWLDIHFERKKDLNKILMSSIDDSSSTNLTAYVSLPYAVIMYTSTFANSAIVIDGASTFNVSNSNFTSLHGFNHIIDVSKSYGTITASTFSGISGRTIKGIIYTTASSVDVTNCSFFDNRSLSCSALHISDSDLQSNVLNNNFTNNTASLVGGAICLMNVPFVIEGNTFDANSALAGGAVYFYVTDNSDDALKLVLNGKENNTFTNNVASVFGDNMDCLPSVLVPIAEYDEANHVYLLEDFKSGANTDMHLILLDSEGDLVSVKDMDNIIFALKMEQFDGLRLNDYKSELLVHNSTLNKSSFYLFSHQIIGTPLQSASLSFTTPSILIDPDVTSVKLAVSFRACQAGEVYTQDTINRYYTCKDCPEGQYSLVVPNSHSVKCLLCPEEEAVMCYGNTIILKQGYWRNSSDSDEILYCTYNPSNCLGNDGCKIGHIGILCENCDITGDFWGQSYSRTGTVEYDCVECRQEMKMNLTVVGQIILMVAYLSWSAMAAINRAKATIAVNVMRRMRMVSLGRSCEISLTAAYIKIASHYFQIVSGLKYFSVQSFLGLDLYVDQIGDAFSKTSFSLDCFLYENFTSWLPLTYLRVIWLHSNAIVCIVLFYICYKIMQLCKKIAPKCYIMTNAMLLFSLFTQYSIISVLISSLSCRQISDKLYVRYFLEMECWSDEHKQLAFTVLLPLLIGQILLFIYKFYVLQQVRKQSDNFMIMLKYGLMYLEYRPSAYYWEFIKNLERFLLTFFINFIDSNDSIKGVMCALVIFAYFILLSHYRPFHKNSLNWLEKKSTIVQMLLYFLTAVTSQKDGNQMLFARTIFVINLAFVVNLLYNVVENNRMIQRIITYFINSVEKKFPHIYGCLKKISSMPQPHVRIRWRMVAQHVLNFLERKKKDKNAELFPSLEDRKSLLTHTNSNNNHHHAHNYQHKSTANVHLLNTLNSEGSYALNTDTIEAPISTEGDQELLPKHYDRFRNISATESILLGGPTTHSITTPNGAAATSVAIAAAASSVRNSRHLRFSARQNSYKLRKSQAIQSMLPIDRLTDIYGNNTINLNSKDQVSDDARQTDKYSDISPNERHEVESKRVDAASGDNDSPQNSEHKRDIVPQEYEVDTDSISLKFAYTPNPVSLSLSGPRMKPIRTIAQIKNELLQEMEMQKLSENQQQQHHHQQKKQSQSKKN